MYDLQCTRYNLLSLAATPHEGQSLASLTARALSAEHKQIDKLRFPCEPQASETLKFVLRNS